MNGNTQKSINNKAKKKIKIIQKKSEPRKNGQLKDRTL